MLVKKYIEVVINPDNTFRLTETENKPQKNGSAAATLKKLELIAVQKLKYEPLDSDLNSTLSEKELYKKVKTQAEEVRKKYDERWAKLNPFVRFLLRKDKSVDSSHKIINENIRIRETYFDSCPKDIINIVAGYLLPKDIEKFKSSDTFSKGNYIAAYTIEFQARELGYINSNYEMNVAFVSTIMRNISKCTEAKILPARFINTSALGASQLLKGLSSEELLKIFSHDAFITEYKLLREAILHHSNEWKVTPFSNPGEAHLKYEKAMILASMEGNTKLLVKLLEHSPYQDAVHKFSQAVKEAMKLNDAKLLDYLLKNGAKELGDDFFAPLLLDASTEDRLEMVELIVKNFPKANRVDINGKYPIQHLTIRRNCNRTNTVPNLLIKFGDYDNKPKFFTTILLSTLMWESSNAETVRLLLDGGADIHVVDQRGNGLLHYASKCGAEVAQALLDRGANVNQMSDALVTPLNAACDFSIKRDLDFIRVLLNNNAAQNTFCKEGFSPLSRAALRGDLEMTKLLLDTCPKEIAAFLATNALKVVKPNLEIEELLTKARADEV